MTIESKKTGKAEEQFSYNHAQDLLTVWIEKYFYLKTKIVCIEIINFAGAISTK